MKLLEVNLSNEKYYTKDFISGYRCGTKRQFEADLTILDKIYADIQKLRGCSCSCSDGIIDDVEDILDKYKAESEE